MGSLPDQATVVTQQFILSAVLSDAWHYWVSAKTGILWVGETVI